MRSKPLEDAVDLQAPASLGAPPAAPASRWVAKRFRGLVARLAAFFKVRPASPAGVRLRSATRWSRFPPDQPPWARAIREVALRLLVFPTLHLLYRVDIRGRERIAQRSGPFLIAANHCLHLDNPLILMALPPAVRQMTAIAAAEDSIFATWRGRWAALLGNAFPISRDRAPRRSLARIEAVLAEGYSVLIYPEGKLTVGGPMQPFKWGVGFIAAVTGTPVLPVLLDVRRFGPAEGRFWPPRGHVRVLLGDLLTVGPQESPSAATSRVEAAVRLLGAT